MKAATTITCTKAEFLTRLTALFVEPVRGSEYDTLELREILNGLAVQADQHRGTFSGYNAYLDLEFIVTPDEPIKIELTESGKAKVAKFLATLRGTAKDAPNMLDRSPAEIREAIAAKADEYQPSAAIAAMIAFVKTQPGYTTEQGYAVFRGIVVAIRTERPDWSDVQARDWLRAQLDQVPDASPADLAAERFANGGQLNGGIGHWSNH